ncbi:hypothetical protein K523DRAFT_85092 [Schizophyllum commune Tattone D]|nr:hypothetical protein K523DRAFT_85092 [Schizophyllum commune Tattone D]
MRPQARAPLVYDLFASKPWHHSAQFSLCDLALSEARAPLQHFGGRRLPGRGEVWVRAQSHGGRNRQRRGKLRVEGRAWRR